jgi:hypothetical protein
MSSHLDTMRSQFKLQNDGEALLMAGQKMLLGFEARNILSRIGIGAEMQRGEIVARIREALNGAGILEAMAREESQREIQKLNSPVAQEIMHGLGLSQESLKSLSEHYFEVALMQIRNEAEKILKFVGV